MSFKNRKFVSWLLSFVLLVSPLTALSLDQVVSAKQDNSSMPCHQVSVDNQSNLCPETGISTCDCCEFSVPAAVSIFNTNPDQVLFVISIYQESYSSRYISQPLNTPFRPPRFSV